MCVLEISAHEVQDLRKERVVREDLLLDDAFFSLSVRLSMSH